MDGCDKDWWHAVSRVIRNKSAHYVLPVLLKRCAEEEKLRKYINKYELPENNSEYWYESYLINWGSFYHSAGGELVEDFFTRYNKRTEDSDKQYYNIVLKMQEKILEVGERDVFRKGSYTKL